MSKSVYSLVLTDEIVRAIDAMAYRMDTSRSALIDRILAERLSMQTPEIRMRNIMENISSFFDEEIFRLQSAASEGGMLIKSPLPYKYKPTIRYSVELLREGKYLGRLKVSFRTQNASLMQLMNIFLNCFASIENRCLMKYDDLDVVMQIDNGRDKVFFFCVHTSSTSSKSYTVLILPLSTLTSRGSSQSTRTTVGRESSISLAFRIGFMLKRLL